uniref:Fibrinogen C-terminal domain-containing protein n=1 Tax=Amphimedon queenslandica TaxID=400682 RepID=A0A1X7V4Z3_AMPQE
MVIATCSRDQETCASMPAVSAEPESNQCNLSNSIQQNGQMISNIVATLANQGSIGISTAGAVDDVYVAVQKILQIQNATSVLNSATPVSCKAIKEVLPNSPSGYYYVNGRNIYCNMEELCGSGGGWTRLAYLDMTDATVNCPSGFRLYQSGSVRACGRPITSGGGCTSVQFPSNGISYSQVCGRVVGYQYGSTDADYPGNYDLSTSYGSVILPHHNDINSYYVDGISITRGSPRQHVWTLMAGLNAASNYSVTNDGRFNCPCSQGYLQNTTLQSFIGNDYFCESGNPVTDGSLPSHSLYTADPLWDGEGCDSLEVDCCTSRPSLPWFNKILNATTTDYLEMRMCGDENSHGEDAPFSFYELYPHLSELNSYVPVDVLKGELSEEKLKKYQVVVLTDSSLTDQVRIGGFCHSYDIKFIVCDTKGLFGASRNEKTEAICMNDDEVMNDKARVMNDKGDVLGYLRKCPLYTVLVPVVLMMNVAILVVVSYNAVHCKSTCSCEQELPSELTGVTSCSEGSTLSSFVQQNGHMISNMSDFLKKNGQIITSTLASQGSIGISTAGAVDDVYLAVQKILQIQNATSVLNSATPVSCKAIKEVLPNSPSGYYYVNGRNIYCNMEELCGSGGGWTRLACLNMTDVTQNCPPGFRLYQSEEVRACGRLKFDRGSCTSVQFPSNGISYSQVCGKVVGYQYATPDAVDHNNVGFEGHNDINSYYVDGISITRGCPRQHVWTLMAGLNEASYHSHGPDGRFNCPCSQGSSQNSTLQSFIGNDYFCESGNPSTDGTYKIELYTSDPLWDGKGCGSLEVDCCTSRPSLPWFNKAFGTTTTDYLELR